METESPKRGPGRPKKLTSADVISIKKALKKGGKLTGVADAPLP